MILDGTLFYKLILLIKKFPIQLNLILCLLLIQNHFLMSKKVKRYTITAALPYTNGPVHIGHLAGVYIPSDIYARFLRSNKKMLCLFVDR